MNITLVNSQQKYGNSALYVDGFKKVEVDADDSVIREILHALQVECTLIKTPLGFDYPDILSEVPPFEKDYERRILQKEILTKENQLADLMRKMKDDR